MSQYFLELLSTRTARFEKELCAFMESRPLYTPPRLWEAMNYSLRAGGKRVRPVLCLEAAELFGASWNDAFPLALAFEMVHTASLIHDDMPCMDNDTLRRGKPTSHVVYGEALALLTGDSLLCFAFEMALSGLEKRGVAPKKALRAAGDLAFALGPSGMCGGQALDIDPMGVVDQGTPFIEALASGKTMRLIQSALTAGARLGNVTNEALRDISLYGAHLGLAFQIADDILDVTATSKGLGKTAGKDVEQQKHTFVHVLGLEEAQQRLKSETQMAIEALNQWPEEKVAFLKAFALYLGQRSC